MREILFRGKQVHALPADVHFDGSWIEGYLSDAGLIFEPESETSFLINPETACQHAGLPDKNGRKIFEGDIFVYHFNDSIIGIVKYGEYKNPFNDDEHAGHVGFYVDWMRESSTLRADLGYWAKVSEIIGNIFDDPELLENI